MKRALAAAGLVVAAFFLIAQQGGAASEQREPVYVGARVCAKCHEGKGMGSQFSKWLLSKHSRAYAVLSMPEAAPIASLSGIPGDPRKSQNCLGCHATASDAEPWEKDPTFVMEDGIQCERCHGPGSEYMDEKVMRDRDAAVKAGLKFFTKHECMLCHYVKGSHVAIHHLPQLDIDKAWAALAHPTPDHAATAGPPAAPAAADSNKGGGPEGEAGAIPAAAAAAGAPGSSGARPAPRYAGARACGTCHDVATQACQFSQWRLSPHAKSYAVLSTPAADEIAAKAGLKSDPQQSRECLRCHVTGFADPMGGTLPSYSVDEGVGCESCHGAGSDYMVEAIMRDGRAARQAGLKTLGRETCLACHGEAHGKPFDVDAALAKMRPQARKAAVDPPRYKTPVNLAFRPDGKEIYVACEAGDSVVVVDPISRSKVGEIPVGGQPADVAFSPDGRRAYVSNRLDDSVSVIDVAARSVLRNVAVGDEPHGLLTDRTGRHLFVLDTAEDTMDVIDTETFADVKHLATSRGPWSLALSPDGSRLLVTNYLSRFVPFRTPSVSEVTAVDASALQVADRVSAAGVNLMLGVAWHPSGEFALVTINRTKNLLPMTRVLQGWTITNGLGIVWKDGRMDQVLLDEPDLYFPDTADVAITPDGKTALATSSGSDRVAVVDVDKLLALLENATAEEREHVIPNHLGKSAEFVVKRISVRNAPRGIAVAPDGSAAFVANSLDDSLSVIDLRTLEETGRIDLGGPEEITKVRRGERLFNSANITFQRQFACHSCHPDGHVDGLQYDIEADGIGVNPVDNRTLRGILDTDPFKWSGLNPSLARQCGPRLAVFFTRLAPFTPEQLDALDEYICTIPRPPNRYRPVGARLTEAQRRGKRIFERAVTNDGRDIPVDNRCSTCHNPPLYTDRSKRDVGTKMALDDLGVFDVPHLNNIYDSAPYLHDGIAPTLEEIWTRYNPNDKHGVTNDLTKDQLNDLIEYLRTL